MAARQEGRQVTDLDYGRFEALTFDCYGTLIDWETGILAGLRPVLATRGIEPPDDELLEAFARVEAALEGGPVPALPRDPRRAACARSPPTTASRRTSPRSRPSRDSVGDWPAFPDSAAALARLHERFRLGVITNCDDDLFARSAARLATDVRLGRDRPAGRELQARRAQLRGRLRADRAAARADPPRRPEPVPRPRPGQAARASRRSGSTAGTVGRAAARRRRPRPRRTRRSRTWRRSRRRRPAA